MNIRIQGSKDVFWPFSFSLESAFSLNIFLLQMRFFLHVVTKEATSGHKHPCLQLNKSKYIFSIFRKKLIGPPRHAGVKNQLQRNCIL